MSGTRDDGYIDQAVVSGNQRVIMHNYREHLCGFLCQICEMCLSFRGVLTASVGHAASPQDEDQPASIGKWVVLVSA